MNNLSYNVYLKKINELEMNFSPIDDEKKEWYYKKLKLEDETRFKIAVNTILETRGDRKYFPLLGEIKKEINQVKPPYTNEPEFPHCERCRDSGYIIRKVEYPDLRPGKPYELAFYCGCEWGERNKKRDNYLIKEGHIKPSSHKWKIYREEEEF